MEEKNIESHYSARQRGFTLVELSIVLVIIGLIAGGILAGNALIKAAEVRSVVSDVDKYKTAIATFQAKYDALPGNMTTATKIFGQATNTCPPPVSPTDTCGFFASASPAYGVALQNGTCDGQGGGALFGPEKFTAWQQLSLAGLIKGTFTGTPGPNPLPTGCNGGYGNDSTPGVNVPTTALAGTGFSFNKLIASSYAATRFAAPAGGQLIFGGYTAGGQTNNTTITPSMALQIDMKYDDGAPATGSVSPRIINSCVINQDMVTTPADGSNSPPVIYNTALSTPACMLYFYKIF